MGLPRDNKSLTAFSCLSFLIFPLYFLRFHDILGFLWCITAAGFIFPIVDLVFLYVLISFVVGNISFNRMECWERCN